MRTLLRPLALLSLAAAAGCLGPLEEPFTDNWMTSWKFQDRKVDVGGKTLRDGRFAVTGKDAFSASFAWVPIELGNGAHVHGTFGFEKPEKIGGDALTGFQIQSLGPEAPLFFLVQSVLIGAELNLNIFAQSGSNLVFQKVVSGQDSVELDLMVDATDFHFFVDGVKEGETPIPNPAIDWVVGYGFSGLHKGERISLDAAMVDPGDGKAGHTPDQQVKRAIFQASVPIQTALNGNDGQEQSSTDLLAALNLAKTRYLAAIDEAESKLTDAKLRNAVTDDLLDTVGKINSLLKKVQKKANQGKSLKQKKVRKSLAKILQKGLRGGLRLATPPFPGP